MLRSSATVVCVAALLMCFGAATARGQLLPDLLPTILQPVGRLLSNTSALLVDITLQNQYLQLFNFSLSSGSCSNLPDLSYYSTNCPSNGFFWDFNPIHRACLANLVAFVNTSSSPTAILQTLGCLRDRSEIHRALWCGALTAIVSKQPVLAGLGKPSIIQCIPDYQIPGPTLFAAIQMAQQPLNQRTCVAVDSGLGSANGPENALWYFREDTYSNLHHFLWHNLYYSPFYPVPRSDRRGELFYYMHKDILARYNANRLTNGLARTVALNSTLFSTMGTGYLANMFSKAANTYWADRLDNTPFAPFMGTAGFPYFDMDTMASRLTEAVNNKQLLNTDGTYTAFTDFSGIDDFEDCFEASVYCKNPIYYGGIGYHNQGHVMIATSNSSTVLPPTLMAAQITSMREPIFYRWHSLVQQYFDSVKQQLTPYSPVAGNFPLGLTKAIAISNIKITYANNAQSVNTFRTFWSSNPLDMPLSAEFGLNSDNDGVQVCTTNLDFVPFKYEITIVNTDPTLLLANYPITVRIFMAPRYDENGVRLSMTDQRALFFALDAFPTTVKIGTTKITRSSDDSSLTVDMPDTVSELLNLNVLGEILTPACGCGWPSHLLLPKGVNSTNSLAGVFDLFVMITDGNQDAVSSSGSGINCNSPYIYCGVPLQKYPDAKPMGYPFDRLPAPGIANLDAFVAPFPNMATIQTTITHDNTAPQPPTG